jgi:DNA-binding MarR family transcriptional regulator
MGDAEALLLHRLRVRSPMTSEHLAQHLSMSQDEVDATLDALVRDGFVRQLAGGAGGWTITAAGRSCHRAGAADQLDASGARDGLTGCYRRFGPLNTEVLDVCTRFQLRPSSAGEVLNDHTDHTYDDDVIRDLHALDRRSRPELEQMARLAGRFGSYGDRLATALDRLDAGDLEWFTSPSVDSYHSVWFELHEDLLATLGLERQREEMAR